MADSALRQGRKIALTITGVTEDPTTDAIKALVKVIEDYEKRVAAGETFSAILANNDTIVVQSGDNPYVLHKFQLVIGTDQDADPAVYNVDYVGYAADVADLPADPTPPAA